MPSFYYPAFRLWPDYLRAGAGLVFCLGLLLFAEPQSVIFAVLAGLGLLFTWLGAATLWRQQIEVKLDASGMASFSRWGFGHRVSVLWSDLTGVDLRYYSTRRDRSEGWLLLTVRSSQARLRVDSDLLGFPNLVSAAIDAAEQRGIALDSATLANAAKVTGSPMARGGLE